ncbi:alpha/beta hydrolase YcfP [Pseudaeromonas sharmana]|uniref:UPF0227 protein ACFOSS_02635 n=1 Tax=Pseudaeromonas sharmana TaxID=328412 RepID=A0ABV8CJF5_9GAMM
MIIYLHGFDATSPGNHEKVLQLQFIDEDVRFVHYSTVHPRHDMSHLLKEVHKQLTMSQDTKPLICGVGLGAYWSERIGFLCGIRQVMFNPNLHPEQTMLGRIERPEEYTDISTKCVTEFRKKNAGNCICILSVNDEVVDNRQTEQELKDYYNIVWDDRETHKFKNISAHLQTIKAFKQS